MGAVIHHIYKSPWPTKKPSKWLEATISLSKIWIPYTEGILRVSVAESTMETIMAMNKLNAMIRDKVLARDKSTEHL